MVGPVNVKKIYAKCEKSLVGCMTSQMVSLDNLVGLVSFFPAFSGFWVLIFQKLKILGSVTIFRESVKLKKTCEWIREIVGGFRG